MQILSDSYGYPEGDDFYSLWQLLEVLAVWRWGLSAAHGPYLQTGKSANMILGSTPCFIDPHELRPVYWISAMELATNHDIHQIFEPTPMCLWLGAVYTHGSSNSRAYCAYAQPSLSYEYLTLRRYALPLRTTQCSNATAIDGIRKQFVCVERFYRGRFFFLFITSCVWTHPPMF